MYIDPLLVGVIATIIVEVAACVVCAICDSIKKKKKENEKI